MTKTQAIKTARDEVSELYPIGDSWRFQTLDKKFNAWRESGPADFWMARVWRSEALIQKAKEALGYRDGEQFVQYGGGSWRDYV